MPKKGATQPGAPEPKAKVDWEQVEKYYRAGVMSLRAIGETCGCSHVGIKKKADKEKWTRDLSAKIKAAAQDKVTKATVTKEVTAETKATEREIIDANATVIKDIILAHRTDIGKSRRIAIALLDELDAQTGDVGALHQLGDMLRTEDEKGVDKLNDLYHKIISMPGRVDSMKKLSETLKNLIALERQAFNVGGTPDDPPPPDENPTDTVRREFASIHARFTEISGKAPTTA